MREIDRVECEAFGHSPKRALRDGLRYSDLALTALVDGSPEAMLGVVVRCAVTGEGTPWMLGTDAVYRHGRDLLKLGPTIIASLFGSTPHLSNIVSATNGRAIRLLRRWGFDVGAEVTTINGVEFVPFGINRPMITIEEREHCVIRAH